MAGIGEVGFEGVDCWVGKGYEVNVEDGMTFGEQVGDAVTCVEGLEEGIEVLDWVVNVRPALPDPPVKTMRFREFDVAILPEQWYHMVF